MKSNNTHKKNKKMIRLLMEVSPLYRTEQTRETFHFVATASYINPHKLSVNVSVWEPKNTTKRKNGVTGKHPRERKKKKKKVTYSCSCEGTKACFWDVCVVFLRFLPTCHSWVALRILDRGSKYLRVWCEAQLGFLFGPLNC